MTINSYQGSLELGACFFIFELSPGSSSELALCSPSISQGIMRDLTQGTFEFIEESLNQLPSIRTLKCFSINTVRLWNGQTCIRAFKIRQRAWTRWIAAIPKFRKSLNQ
ncbi:hypothetical protein NQ317_014114 [Molorchus minor]|uniref:Uncharacterized protein n=1 Tax=Molorchus minor TaxID=1323400 RepID=A0ABQ9JNX3_9CUCU|nr:hypothetical protein NQ317_014114 [Molorchus minor]